MKRSAELAFLPKQGGTLPRGAAGRVLEAAQRRDGDPRHRPQRRRDLPRPVPQRAVPAAVQSADRDPDAAFPRAGDHRRPVQGAGEAAGRRSRRSASPSSRCTRTSSWRTPSGPYRKSLLYLVSRSFEDEPEMPILGLEESLRARSGHAPASSACWAAGQRRQAEIAVLGARKTGRADSTIATQARRLRQRPPDDVGRHPPDPRASTTMQPIVEFPETVSRTVLDARRRLCRARRTVPGGRAALPPAPRRRPRRRSSPRRRAAVARSASASTRTDPPNRLAGCVNDAKRLGRRRCAASASTTSHAAQRRTPRGRRCTRCADGPGRGARPATSSSSSTPGTARASPISTATSRAAATRRCARSTSRPAGFLIDDDVRAMSQHAAPTA